MNQEHSSSYMQNIKFDLRHRRINNVPSSLSGEIVKRKNSFSLSSDACRSPKRRVLKQEGYFWSLIKQRNSENELLEELKHVPLKGDSRITYLLEEYGYIDEMQMFSQIQHTQQQQQTKTWCKEDSRLLIWLICKLGGQRMKDISQIMNRPIKDIKSQWNQLLRISQRGLLWSIQEDQTLQNMIMTYLSNQQPINWKCMGNVLNKSDKQCQDRWYNVLDPAISRETFYIEDDLQLLQLVQKFGKKWKRVQREWALPKKRSRQDLKKRFYELIGQADSGYNSDTSSNSAQFQLLNQSDMEVIQKMIEQLKLKCDDMQIESKVTGRDKLLKNKLLNIAKSDLDKMLNQQRKIKIQSTCTPTNEKKTIYEEDEVKEMIPETPNVNSLSRFLLKMHIENDDDQLSIEKQSQNKVVYNVDSVEHLTHEDIFDIQFALVNEKTNTLYYANLDFMQQLLNLITNQRKLMQLTDANPRRSKKKLFSSQQLIQIQGPRQDSDGKQQ